MYQNKIDTIEERYINGFVTDSQLERYHKLGVLTDEQYTKIYQIKYPPVVEEVEPELEPTESTEEETVVEEETETETESQTEN